MATTYSLTMQSGPTPGLVIPLERHSILLGRDPQADLVINDPEVSRSHARLIAKGDSYTIEDLGSTNGTFLNDQRISAAAPLYPGDVIRLGDMVVLIYKGEAVDDAVTAGFPLRQPSTESASHAMDEPAARPAPAPMAAPQPEPEPEPLAPMGPPTEQLPPIPSRPRRRARRSGGGLRLPSNVQPWMVIAAVVVLLGACAAIFFLWYIDVNYLWCDVFGGLIPACP